jgi:hypothetical protein
MAKEIDILVLEPGEAPRPAKAEDTWEAFQKIMGGPIEAGAALALVVQLTGRLDALRIEGDCNLSEHHTKGPHCKNAADHGRGLLIDDEAVLSAGSRW